MKQREKKDQDAGNKSILTSFRLNFLLFIIMIKALKNNKKS